MAESIDLARSMRGLSTILAEKGSRSSCNELALTTMGFESGGEND